MRVEEPADLIFAGLMYLSFALGVVGGLGTLAVLVDSQHSRRAAPLGFACLFALVGSLGTAYLCTFVAVRLSIPSGFRSYPFTVGYLTGGGVWFLLGLRLASFYERAVRPMRRHRSSLVEQLR